MKTLTQLVESKNMYSLEYKIKNSGTEHYECKEKYDALKFLSRKTNVEYAFLFKPTATNYSEPESLAFWYSEEESNNYWNNTYKSNGLKDNVKKQLEKLRISELK